MFYKKIKPVLIKLEGKESLCGRHSKSCVFLMLQIFVAFVSGFLSYLAAFRSEAKTNLKLNSVLLVLLISAVSLLFFSLINQGEEAWRCCLSNRREPSFRHALFWLMPSHCIKSFAVNIVLTVKKMFWNFLFLLPGSVLILLAYFMVKSQEMTLSLISFLSGCLSFVIGLLFAFIINQRYFLSKYLIAKYPQMHVKDAVSESINLMNGICLSTSIFKLSFLPLFLICLVGFPCIFVYPYFRQSCVVLKREIIGSSFSQKQSE